GRGGIGGKSRQDEVAAEQFVHRGHHLFMLNDLLEDLALVDEVEDALVDALGLEESGSAFAFRGIQSVDRVLDLCKQVARDEIRHHANAVGFDLGNDRIDISSHRYLASPERSFNSASARAGLANCLATTARSGQ